MASGEMRKQGQQEAPGIAIRRSVRALRKMSAAERRLILIRSGQMSQPEVKDGATPVK